MGLKEIQITLDFRSGIPIYIQIMDEIRKLVVNNYLQQGDQLPTVRQMATDLRINWNTVARAYKLLDEAGLISTQQGRGTYVWETPSEATTQALWMQTLQGLTRRYLAQASRLGYKPDDISQKIQEQLTAWENDGPPNEE